MGRIVGEESGTPRPMANSVDAGRGRSTARPTGDHWPGELSQLRAGLNPAGPATDALRMPDGPLW